MPYIKESRRQELLVGGKVPETSGELNFWLTKSIIHYINRKGLSYNTLNEVIGVLECIKQELYRRVISPYEDKKVIENGDVFQSVENKNE